MGAALALLILAHGGNLNTRLTAQKEAEILESVADEYGLKGKARQLLYTIRRIENGGPGQEMGIETAIAKRFARYPAKSLTCQARWAAGTIIHRWNGNIDEFATRWCPANTTAWTKMAKQYMRVVCP